MDSLSTTSEPPCPLDVAHMSPPRNVDYESIEEAEIVHKELDALCLPSDIVDIDFPLEEIINKLNTTRILSLVGMGGSGKTTLAMAAFNALRPKFEYTCFVSHVTLIHGNVEDVKETLWKSMHWNGQEVGEEDGWYKLKGKHLLLLLDDISNRDAEVLCDLACHTSSESRFIVTSQDKGLVKGLGEIYEVPFLNKKAALQLFTNLALPSEAPQPFMLEDIIEAILNKCDGLPLALVVVGSFLRQKETEVWRQTLLALDKGEGVLPIEEKLWAHLMRSYHGLGEKEQQIFLDATTFFSGNRNWNLGDAKAAWTITYETDTVLPQWQTLVSLSLVANVADNESIKVHELLRSLGRKIASSGDTVERRIVVATTRVLEHLQSARDEDYDQDVDALRLGIMGLDREGSPSVAADPQNTGGYDNEKRNDNEEIHIGSTSMKIRGKLCFLDVTCPAGIHGAQGSELFPKPAILRCGPELSQVLFHSDFGSQLVVLKLSNWRNTLGLPNSIGRFSALKRFILSSATSLESLPEAIGNLLDLEVLELHECHCLRSLPETFGELSSLRQLVFRHCQNLHSLPTSFGHLRNLSVLEFLGCDELHTLPTSFGKLISLKHLRFENCDQLLTLPESIGQLQSLLVLEFIRCCLLHTLPESFGHLKTLKLLRFEGCFQLRTLPASFRQLEALSNLELIGCEHLRIGEETPSEDKSNLWTGSVRVEVLSPRARKSRLSPRRPRMGKETPSRGNRSLLALTLRSHRAQEFSILDMRRQETQALSFNKTPPTEECPVPELITVVPTTYDALTPSADNAKDDFNAKGIGKNVDGQEVSEKDVGKVVEMTRHASRSVNVEEFEKKLEKCPLPGPSRELSDYAVKLTGDNVKDDLNAKSKGKGKDVDGQEVSEKDAGQAVERTRYATRSVFVEEFRRKVEEGGEDGYFVSSKWLLGLEKHERESLMSVLWRTGYSEICQTTTTTLFVRIEDDVQHQTTDNGASSTLMENYVCRGPTHELGVLTGVDDQLGIGGPAKKKEKSDIPSDEVLQNKIGCLTTNLNPGEFSKVTDMDGFSQLREKLNLDLSIEEAQVELLGLQELQRRGEEIGFFEGEDEHKVDEGTKIILEEDADDKAEKATEVDGEPRAVEPEGEPIDTAEAAEKAKACNGKETAKAIEIDSVRDSNVGKSAKGVDLSIEEAQVELLGLQELQRRGEEIGFFEGEAEYKVDEGTKIILEEDADDKADKAKEVDGEPRAVEPEGEPIDTAEAAEKAKACNGKETAKAIEIDSIRDSNVGSSIKHGMDLRYQFGSSQDVSSWLGVPLLSSTKVSNISPSEQQAVTLEPLQPALKSNTQHSSFAETLVSLQVALKSNTHRKFCANTKWLSNLKDHEKEAVAQLFWEGGYEKIYETSSTTWYVGSGGHVENPADGGYPRDTNSSTLCDKKYAPCDDVSRSRTSKRVTLGWEEMLIMQKKHKANIFVGLAREMSTSHIPCHPQLLSVACSSFSHTSMEPPACDGQFRRQQVGDMVVKMPQRDQLKKLSTTIDKSFPITTVDFLSDGRGQEVSVNMKVTTITSIDCCCLRGTDHNLPKVRIKFSRMFGEVKKEYSNEQTCNAMALSCVCTSLGGLVVTRLDGDRDDCEEITLTLEDEYHPPQRRVLPSSQQVGTSNTNDLVWLAISDNMIDSSNGLPESVTVELRGDVTRRRKADLDSGVQRAHILHFQDPRPLIFEGNIALHPTSFLELHMRHQLEVSYLQPCGAIHENAPVWNGQSTSKVIEFDCYLKIRNEKFEFS